MSDLVAAMQAAVDSVDARPRGTVKRPRTDPDPMTVRVLNEHALPPVTPRRGSNSFTSAVAATFGPVASWTWLVLREAFLFIALFWTVALLMAAAAPGLATLGGVLIGTVVLRVALLIAMQARVWSRSD